MERHIRRWEDWRLLLQSLEPQCIESIWKALKTEDWHFGKHIPMLLSLKTLCQQTVLKKWYITKPETSCIKRFVHRHVCHQRLGFQGVPHEEPQQDEANSRKRYIGRAVHEIMLHPNNDALIAELRRNTPYTHFSEESKQMIHTLGHVESFELCQVSQDSMSPLYELLDGRNYLFWLRYLLYSPSSQSKRVQTGEHGKPKKLWKRRKRRVTNLFLHRFQKQEFYRNSQTCVKSCSPPWACAASVWLIHVTFCGCGSHHSSNTQHRLTRRFKQRRRFARDHSWLNRPRSRPNANK